ncbi:MAG: hypothetical protein ACLQPH_04335 [Acidimicrobiales bacterium]
MSRRAAAAPGVPLALLERANWQFAVDPLDWSFGWPRVCGGVPIPLQVVLLRCAPDCGADGRRVRGP